LAEHQDHLSWRPAESTTCTCVPDSLSLGFQGRSPWLFLAAALHTVAAFVARPSKAMAPTFGDEALDLGFKGMSLRHRHKRDSHTFHRITVFNGNARAADNVEVLLLDVDIGDGNDLPGHYPHNVDSPFTLNPGAHRDVDFARSWTDATGRLMVEWIGSTLQETELKEGQCWHIRIGARSASHQLRPLAIFMKYKDGHVWTDSILLSLAHRNPQ
jgi:hypothetical protein